MSALTGILLFACVVLFIGMIVGIALGSQHAERAKSMYRFIEEVNALDKYVEWEGLRRVKKEEDYKLKLYEDYGQDRR